MPRWRFLDRAVTSESTEYERVIGKMDDWWREFARRGEDLKALFAEKQKWDLPEWMASHLQAIDPRLMWEFGPAVRGGDHRLVITPESAKHLRPLVATLLERAPAFPEWEFYGYRLPETLELAKAAVRARTGGDLSDVLVHVARGAHNLVDLTYLSPRTRKPSDVQARHDAFVATEVLLGEQVLDQWIGAIEVAPLTPSGRAFSRWFGRHAASEESAVPIHALKPAVETTITQIRSELATEPPHAWGDNVKGTLLKLTPTRADDYPEQRDLFVAKTTHLEQWQAAHAGAAFYDVRFSRVGETFAYVKLDGSQGLDQEKFADKSEIEDAIDEVLAPAGLGCHIGGGTGLRYSYIDVALTDLERGIEAIATRLRAGNVPRRSWIQFFNADWNQEWVGIYPDSPPAPMSEP